MQSRNGLPSYQREQVSLTGITGRIERYENGNKEGADEMTRGQILNESSHVLIYHFAS
jgi:hypothetical protein